MTVQRVWIVSLLLATSAFGNTPRVTGVRPTPIHPGGQLTITAEYIPAAINEPTISLRKINETAGGQSVNGVAGDTTGLQREYHATVPTELAVGEYRVFLQYDGIPPPGLVAPASVRVDRPLWLADMPWVGGIVAVLVGLVIAMLVTGRKLGQLWLGADGTPSTSKFQFVLWSTVILFVFGTIATLYLAHRKPIDTDAACSFPQNVWIVLGLSGITAIAAKGITVGHINAGRLTTHATEGGLLTSDAGGPELFKVQLLTWTFVAIVIYAVQFLQALSALTPDKLTTAPGCHVPDIDTTLMVLMGLSQGTYLGKKLVTTDTARITGINPPTGVPGTNITLKGAGFGDAQYGSIISIDNQPVATAATWTDPQVTLRMPSNINGVPLAPGPHTIALVVNGRGSIGTAPFTLTPHLESIMPSSAAIATIATTTLSLSGDAFGATKGLVLIDSSEVPEFHILRWTNQLIQVKLAPTHPNGQPWRPGKIGISVVANSERSVILELPLT